MTAAATALSGVARERSDLDALTAGLHEAFAGRINDFRVVPLSAALAAHVGPGAMCVAVAPVLTV